MAKKVKQPKKELPLAEDYREAGQMYEYESDEAREAARKAAGEASKKPEKRW